MMQTKIWQQFFQKNPHIELQCKQEEIDLPSSLLAIKNACETSFYAFVREAWPHIEGNPYRDGWHVRAICDHLEALSSGDIKRLLINQPPRTSKPVADHMLVCKKVGEVTKTGKRKNTFKWVEARLIRVGDHICTHKGRFKSVTKVFQQGVLPVLKITTAKGRVLEVEKTHPFLMADGHNESWCEAAFLKKHDRLATVLPREKFLFDDHVVDMTYGGQKPCLCFDVEEDHSFTIDNVVVHNSSLCAVLYPAWLFLKNPSQSLMAVSYSKQLTVRDSSKCRRLIQTPWYQSLWPHVQLSRDENQKMFFSTTKGGYRIATSTGASTTGWGASTVLCDDLDSISDIYSKTYRENNAIYFDEVLSTRHSGDPSSFRMIVVQQRAHHQDISGHILAKNDPRWVHLRLPMEFEEAYRCRTLPLYNPTTKKMAVWQDPRTKEGEILWPEMLKPDDIKFMKEKDFRGDDYIIAGQLQQRPTPKGGGIFKTEWFHIWDYEEDPPIEFVIQSWDTAFASGKDAAFSAALTLGVFKDRRDIRNIILLSAFQERLQFPELKQMAQRLSQNIFDVDVKKPLHWKSALKPDVILVEGKASGYSLIQEMERMLLPVSRFDPGRYGDKEARAHRVADIVENGMMWVRGNGMKGSGPSVPDKYGLMLLKETAQFPAGESMDMVDAFSQSLIYLKDKHMIYFAGYAEVDHSRGHQLVQEGAHF